MAAFEEGPPTRGTVGERLVLLWERLRQVDVKISKIEATVAAIQIQIAETLRLISTYSELKPDVLLIMQQTYENEEADKREFYKAVKVAAITLLCSVVALVAEYFLTHGH